jgi:hypothetical protein
LRIVPKHSRGLKNAHDAAERGTEKIFKEQDQEAIGEKSKKAVNYQTIFGL